MLTLKWNWGLAANSLKHLAKLATAVTAVKAGDNELTFVDGINGCCKLHPTKSFREQYEDVASQAICRLISYSWLQRLVGKNAPFLTWIDPSTESYSRIQFSELTLRTMGSDSFGPSLTFQRYICQSLTSETGTCRTLSLILKAEHTFTSEFLSKWQTWRKIKIGEKESVHWDKGEVGTGVWPEK